MPGWSGSAATLPRTMPSTRNPPLKITLPSMRVVAPIRLSIRFCGLLVLLNTSISSACYNVTEWVARGWFDPVS